VQLLLLLLDVLVVVEPLELEVEEVVVPLDDAVVLVRPARLLPSEPPPPQPASRSAEPAVVEPSHASALRR
jgi:hypothetical protein